MSVSNEELKRINRFMEGREFQMIEVKKKANELLRNAGRPELYPLSFLKK